MEVPQMKSITEKDQLSGLVIIGTVKERSRRYANVRGSQVEIVTYVVTDANERRYYIEDFAPSEHYNIDDSVTIPVYIKPYRKKTGDPSYSLCVQKEHRSLKGEAF
jgi:hypothetical protein